VVSAYVDTVDQRSPDGRAERGELLDRVCDTVRSVGVVTAEAEIPALHFDMQADLPGHALK
jgi:hypothetical protein